MSKQGIAVAARLRNILRRPPPNAAAVNLYKEKNLDRLIENFKTSSNNKRFRAKPGIYFETVRRLTNAKRLDRVEELIEHQKNYPDMTKEGFNARLILLYGEASMFDHAKRLFDEMPERGCKRTVLSFNALLAACLSSKKFEQMEFLFRDLSDKLGFELNVISYTTVIGAFCEMGSFDSAISLLEEMESKGLKPNVVTFNTFLYAFYRKGRFLDGEGIWNRMLEKDVCPNILSYNAKLIGLAMEKKMRGASDLVAKMESQGVKPDLAFFNDMIKGLIEDEGNLEQVKRWYNELGETKYKPNKVTFSTLIPFACEKHDFSFAFKLVQDVFSTKCVVDEPLLQLVADELVKQSMIEEATQVAKLSKNNDYCRYKVKLSI